MTGYHRVRFDINASHSPDGQREHAHPHTFTFELEIGDGYSEEKTRDIIEDRKARYDMAYLNDCPAFSGTLASLEDIGNIFFREISREMEEAGMTLLSLSVGDHPTAVYRVRRGLQEKQAQDGTLQQKQ